MAEVQGPGLADLEKELGCSICTELLYQPLTLLDCLHTFCGSCLKEWFTAQGGRRRPSGTSPRFTCPSCRAEVRGTRPNATVTTLLDMVLLAHPDRARSTEEKEEIARRYTPGASVFPPPQEENESEDDEEDRRVLQEVQELSLRENRAQARREARRTGHSERTRERSSNPETHTDDGRSRRRREHDPERQQRSSRPLGEVERSRRVEHQSSIRSLLSLSSETETMEEEILRQIIEDGLLDDIDLDNLGPSQEEELSERIADAYRRRHMHQPRTRQPQRRRQSPENAGRTHSRSQSVQRTDETSTVTRDSSDRRPPTSRPHLFDPMPQDHQRRNSEQASNRMRTSPTRVNQASHSNEALRPAVRSSSDMTAERTHSSQNGRTRAQSSSARARRATESDQNISNAWMGGPWRERGSSRQNVTSQTMINTPTSTTSSTTSPPQGATSTGHTAAASSSPLVPPRSERRPRSSRSNATAPSNVPYVEPAISCDSCGKTNIQYNLHKKCLQCKGGNYHLCLRCYREGLGCLQWSGFERSAQVAYEQMLASSNQRSPQILDPGHKLVSLKYQRPPETAQIVTNREKQMTDDDPTRRLETGLFCDICESSTNECFWKCNRCNMGDWGFCNKCVNQGRCCTHALLPIRRISGSPIPSTATTATDTTSDRPPRMDSDESYKILSFTTNCDICTYPIPASATRFHCLECNDGNYDVCKNCYLKLVATSKISKENGYNGWRLCLAGHRMIIVEFEDHQDGQRRVIKRDRVGGIVGRSPSSLSSSSAGIASPRLGNGDWSWKDGQERRKKASRFRASTGSPSNSAQNSPSSEASQATGTPSSPHGPPVPRYTPDGGVGLVVQAQWSFYPQDGATDELFFPRGADINEVEIVNDEWFWGSYAGRTGLFPGKRVVVLEEIP
ncbi:hypothetical protein N7462_007492 [Penicillium macrosclerotiorum]|uniref:uncharacterized protein n=1 Tax=Penicillium macrosclerotiorum TaxID=303699 RepID=UPI002546DE75|nr:uncharacterized protein N7462_007492 [Penicillium macrosclerotiorum]KAJ5679248.1 hypothetical protein N7462_007492 [Penicillium macrosclerotiorum]